MPIQYQVPSGLGDIANQRVTKRPEKEKLQPPKHLISITEIRPYLYMSGFGCITDAKLKNLGITHAVDCTNLNNAKKFTNIEYLQVPAEDTITFNAAQYFETVSTFIQGCKDKGGKCIVFCAAGISRSATFTLMYLVIKEDVSLKDAYFEVNKCRPIISPNTGFWQQMIDFEAKLKGGANFIDHFNSGSQADQYFLVLLCIGEVVAWSHGPTGAGRLYYTQTDSLNRPGRSGMWRVTARNFTQKGRVL